MVAFDRVPDQGKLAAFIGYDAVQAGKNGAKALCDAVGGSGKVAELQGLLGTSVARDRSKGFRAGMKACPGVDVVAVQSADFDRGKALDVTTNSCRRIRASPVSMAPTMKWRWARWRP